MLKKLAVVAALMLGLVPPLAAQILVVEGVLSPAWLERGGKREPLATGMTLEVGDKVHTGPGARALLRLAEGSAVKLGENAIFAVDRMLFKQAGERSFLSAGLDAIRGAFRFTTGVFSKRAAERDVEVKISTITAGIRGTDVWGRSTAREDVVCLIEGRVSVVHGGKQVVMAGPLLFFVAPRGAAPLPVGPVAQPQVEGWVQETEMRAGSGASRPDGRYRVDVLSTRDREAALQAQRRAREAGFPARVESLQDSYGNEDHHVRIAGLVTARDAAAVVEKLKALGLAEARGR
jgi:hypothetical protein